MDSAKYVTQTQENVYINIGKKIKIRRKNKELNVQYSILWT